MSEQTTLDNGATTSVASNPVAPPQAGDPQGSTPAPVDTTVPSEPKSAGAEQTPRRDRAFATLRRENRELHRTLGRLEERIEALSRAPQPQPADGEPPPQRQEHHRAPAIDRAEVELNKSVLQRIEEAGDDADDVDEVMEKITSDDVPISRAMRDYLGEAEQPFALAKWLSENPSEARRISRLSEAVAVRALERAEAKLGGKPKAAKPTSAPSRAPEPVPQISGGSGAASQDVERMSHEDLKKLVVNWSR